jgi:flagellar biosynthesis protein FlhB
MPQNDPSRTEQATAKRREKARDEGNVPRSQELSKVMVLAAGFLLLHLFFSVLVSEILGIFRLFTGSATTMELTQSSVHALMISLSFSLAKMLLPILLCLALVSMVTVRIQVGPLWTTKVFVPKPSKFNPFKGMKKLFFSTQTIVRLLRSLFMASVVAIAPIIVLRSQIDNLLPLFHQEIHGIVAFMLHTGSTMVMYALLPMLLIGLADLVYSRWEYEENLKMTKGEVKDERKQSEGDPWIKGAQRKKMFAVMQQRMLEKVPKADVIVTNPTRLAVALRYNALEAPAPVVLAKGADFLAEKIKEIAREHKIPIRENKPLAQALYRAVEVGEMIPEELYQAAASVLAELFKTRSRTAGST